MEDERRKDEETDRWTSSRGELLVYDASDGQTGAVSTSACDTVVSRQVRMQGMAPKMNGRRIIDQARRQKSTSDDCGVCRLARPVLRNR